MKKIFGILLALLLLMTLPIVLAEDENSDVNSIEPVLISTNTNDTNDSDLNDSEAEEEASEIADEETVSEVEIMNSTLGAEIRILQLQRASLKRTIAAEKIVEILDNNELENLFAELELLNGQIMEMTVENSDVDDFTVAKKDLHNLSRKFKEASKGLLTANNREEVKTVVDAIEELDELDTRIKQKIREHNAEKTKNALTRMGVSDEELIIAIQNGDATPQEVKDALKEAYTNLSDEKKIMAKEKVKENIKNKYEKREQIKQKIVQNYVQKQRNLLAKRLANASPEAKEKIKENIEAKQDVLKRKEKILNKALQNLKQKETQIINQKIKNKVRQKIASNVKGGIQ